MDRTLRQKFKTQTIELTYIIEQLILTGIYRTLHSAAAAHTFFSLAYRTFSRRDQIAGHKTSLDKFKKAHVISQTFPAHSGMNKRTFTTNADTKPHTLEWTLCHSRNQKRNKRTLLNENENTRGKFIATCAYIKHCKPIKAVTTHLKDLKKGEQNQTLN